MLDHETGRRIYRRAAADYESAAASAADCRRRIEDSRQELNAQQAAADGAKATRLDLEARRQELQAALASFDVLDDCFAAARAGAAACGCDYASAVVFSGAAPAALAAVFDSRSVDADAHTGQAKQNVRAELRRIEEAIRYLEAAIRRAQQQMEQQAAAIRRLTESLEAAKAGMRRSAAAMQQYAAYRNG